MTAPDDLVLDLIGRTEKAVEKVARLAVDTGITFSVPDVVQCVEDDLPADYPAPAVGGVAARREMVGRMATDIVSGDMYES